MQATLLNLTLLPADTVPTRPRELFIKLPMVMHTLQTSIVEFANTPGKVLISVVSNSCRSRGFDFEMSKSTGNLGITAFLSCMLLIFVA